MTNTNFHTTPGEKINLMHSVLNGINDGVIIIDNNDRIKFINSVCEKLTGAKSDSAIGKYLKEVYLTFDDIPNDYFICMLANSSQEKFLDLIKSRILINSDGNSIPIEENVSNIVENDNVIGKIIVFRDISKFLQLEAELISSRHFYIKLFEDFPALIWMTSVDGSINYFNKTWLNFTGRNLDEEVNGRWKESVHPGELELFLDSFNEHFMIKSSLEYEFRLRNKHGEYIWFICKAIPYYNSENDFAGYIGVLFEIHNRKMMEREIILTKNTAENAIKAKSEFLSNMSHELRTPMNGIIGLTDILLDSNPDEMQRQYLEMLKKCSFSLLELINNILDSSRLETGSFKLRTRKIDFKSLITKIISSFIPIANDKNLTLTYSIDNNIPEYLIADSEKLYHAIYNLINNSIKFTDIGRIELSVYPEPGITDMSNKIVLHFKVADTGIGISEEKKKIIFDSFTQADSSFTKKYSGAGLGLSISKRIIEIMNGNIWVDSTPGKGSIFHFTAELGVPETRVVSDPFRFLPDKGTNINKN